MRRTVIAVTALLCLAFAGSAAAASSVPGTATNNGYSASYTVSGGAKKDVGVTMVENLKTTPPTGFGAPYPLADIYAKVQGVTSPYAKYFPTCSVAKINTGANTGDWNSICPKGSQVAVGTLISAIIPNTSVNPMLNAANALADPCTLTLHVYNAGVGKLAYFFTVSSGSACGGLSTGAAPAYPGTNTSSGGYAVNNVPENASISFDAGGTGDWGALLSEKLTWHDTVKHKGKTYSYLVSTGCKKARKWSVKYTGTTAVGDSSTPPSSLPPASSYLPAVTVSGSGKC